MARPTRRTSRYLAPKKAILAAYLPPDGAGKIRGVFYCELERDLDLDAMYDALASMAELTWSWTKKGRARALEAVTPYRQIAFRVFAKADRWRVEAHFAHMGTDWGSNEAYWCRFKQEAFPLIDAHDVVELTNNHPKPRKTKKAGGRK